jgi:hypothetical protein
VVKFISDDEYGGMMATSRTRAGKKQVSIAPLKEDNKNQHTQSTLMECK